MNIILQPTKGKIIWGPRSEDGWYLQGKWWVRDPVNLASFLVIPGC